MLNKILVPLDGSELAQRSLDPALSIARGSGGKVILLNVPIYRMVLVPGTAGLGQVLPDDSLDLVSRDQTLAYLERIKEARQEPDLAIKTVVMEGDVAGNIVDLAANEGVDLIVMTTHGYSGFTHWMMGSITERVLRHAPCPVLVIRCEDKPAQVAITLDGSLLAEEALGPGLELARLFGAQVTLFRVEDESELGRIEKGMLDMASPGLSWEVVKGTSALHYLENIASAHRFRALPIEIVVAEGPPARAILEFIEENQVDLLVMATHGRTGIRRWVYGSVTEKCLHNTACAILVVRPPVEAG
jgi:nucleotide-binding universal stress UspA family protein